MFELIQKNLLIQIIISWENIQIVSKYENSKIGAHFDFLSHLDDWIAISFCFGSCHFPYAYPLPITKITLNNFFKHLIYGNIFISTKKWKKYICFCIYDGILHWFKYLIIENSPTVCWFHIIFENANDNKDRIIKICLMRGNIKGWF